MNDDSHVVAYRVPKISPFWRNDPETWFIQIEASFRVVNITVERTKADYLTASIDAELLAHVSDLLRADPPLEDPYQQLKDRILATFTTSPEARLRQLLKGQVLGDQKPSHLLNHMKNLNRVQCSNAVLRALFIELLPDTHKAILVTANELDLQKLAEIADKLTDLNGPSTNLAVIAPAKKPMHHKADATSNIEEKLDKLTKQFRSLSNDMAKIRRDRSSSRNRYKKQSNKANKTDKQSGYCFIHRKYGNKATSCRKPCTWQAIKNSEN